MIPIFKPSYDSREAEAVRRVLSSGWVGLGPKTAEFEKRFARYIGTRYAVAVNSCTAALHLALRMLEVAGKEVITTPMTFVSTNLAILYNGAIPVFTDIQEGTLNIDPAQVKKNITRRTKAIILVHYGGHPCDIGEIMAIARRHGLAVVEDAAHACGAQYRGRMIGSFGALACFSFHAVKNLATGDGGMITTDDKKFYHQLLRARWCGIDKSTWQRDKSKRYSWFYDIKDLGYKYHMNDITAAIGLVQLKKLEELNEARRTLASCYDHCLAGVKEIILPEVKEGIRHARHNYVIRTPSRNKLNQHLAQKGISSGVHYYPNNLYRLFKRYPSHTPIARRVWQQLLTLPLYPDLKVNQVNMISGEIKKCLSSTGT
jgi:perosamine synthetase